MESEEMGVQGKEFDGVFIQLDSIGPLLIERAARDVLRSEIDPGIAEINRRLEAGDRIRRIDSTVGVEGNGLTLIVWMDKR